MQPHRTSQFSSVVLATLAGGFDLVVATYGVFTWIGDLDA